MEIWPCCVQICLCGDNPIVYKFEICLLPIVCIWCPKNLSEREHQR